MPRIRVVPFEESSGDLRLQYDAALKRAGRIWNIVAIMSQNPSMMKASMDFYLALMYGPSSLNRAQREMLAVVVSSATLCIY